jgi:hypothetical protein
MPLGVVREGFAQVVAELIDLKKFVPPLSVMGVADDGSMFGARLERVDGALTPKLVCQHLEIQFGLPINLMVVDDANRVARVLFRINGERAVTVL